MPPASLYLRRLLKAGFLATLLTVTTAWSAPFGFADVASRAQKLAQKSYVAPSTDLPRELRDLNYDQYRDIRFRADKAIWHAQKLPFELQLFHPGLYYNTPVKISLINNGVASPLGFNPDLFDYGKNNLDRSKLRNLSYAGFRVHFPVNVPNYKDEVLVFQGASYFRGLGRGQRYGMSARGLAVDTGVSSGEEFPIFTEFWIETPTARSQELTIYALLDSKRVTGAYKFIVRPGVDTVMDVQERIFLREGVSKLGIAPLTSMFYHGSNQTRFDEDYRPEVHDSDGLLIRNPVNNEWIWRPLVNPRKLVVSSYGLINPRGFGLLQRRRDFGHYEDLEARYDLRPSTWVEPKGDWGAGRIELVLIPTPDETNDNVVAYWVPNSPPLPGQPLDLQYRLSWQKDNVIDPPVASVLQTRKGHGYYRNIDDTQRMVIDFEDPPPAIPASTPAKPSRKHRRKMAAAPTAVASTDPIVGMVWADDNAELLEKQTFRNDVTGGWRMSFRFRRLDDDKPVEMRAYLKRGGSQVSETWSYLYPAN